jgi:sugar transferase (PEP-CTERM/EpsH1 system associated)
MRERLAGAVKSRGYDLAFVFGSSMVHFVAPYPELPVILDLVDVDSDKWMQYSQQARGPLRWLWRREARKLEECEAAFVKKCAETFVCTDAEAAFLRRKAAIGKISVLQNSVDLNHYSPGIVPVPAPVVNLQSYVLFTGTMDYFPNVDAVQWFANEIFPLIRKRVPSVGFVIAGRNPTPRVRNLSKLPGIHVTGAVPDIRPYLQGAALVVAPMRIARGVQNKILEALAMDVLVVASSVATNALPRDLKLLVEQESDPRQFAERVISHLIRPAERTFSYHASIKRYIESLELPVQLERAVSAAGSKPEAINVQQEAIAI